MQKIYNIESLHPGDLKTYQDLEDVVTLHKNKPDDLDYELYHVTDRQSLESVFEEILNDVKNDGIKPILHFDLHGYEDGIDLNSGEVVDWNEIADSLIEINKASNIQLFVCAGACFGVGMVKITNFMKRAPYSVLVGPNGSIKAKYISEFYSSLYNEYLDTGDIKDFFDKSDLIPEKFSAIWIKTAYDMLFDIETAKNNGSYNDAFVHWVQNIFKGDRDEYSNKELLQKFDNWFVENSNKLKKDRFNEFFMIDLFPENNEIFKFEDA
jgi:hypothetical protein